MSTGFVNEYKPPAQVTLFKEELYGPEPYDINFVFPVRLEHLESERVKLTPFVPSLHSAIYWAEVEKTPDLFRYYPFTLDTLDQFLTYHELRVRRDPANNLFVIIDKTKPDPGHPELGGSIAGVLGLYFSSATQLYTEIAYVAILPAFQRTHVASNAVGILLKYCLQLPTANPPGLGLRRVQWCAHSKNIPSGRLAERMGFKREGIIRWHYVLSEPLARDGMKPREGDQWPERYGRDTQQLSLCWDDWENGGRDIVQREIDRVI